MALTASVLQISFCMVHIGAASDLQHLASFNNTIKKIGFYAISFWYFAFSLSSSLYLTTYLANTYSGQLQLLAFLTILRLVLPESSFLKRSKLPKWVIKAVSIICPFISHIPIYVLVSLQISGNFDLYAIGIQEVVTMDSLRFHPNPPCPLPNPFTPRGWATPETALWLFQGWSARRARGLRSSSTPLDIPTPYVYALCPAGGRQRL
jgi:hypothetical protein